MNTTLDADLDGAFALDTWFVPDSGAGSCLPGRSCPASGWVVRRASTHRCGDGRAQCPGCDQFVGTTPGPRAGTEAIGMHGFRANEEIQ